MGSKFQVWWKWTIEILVIKGDRKKASSKEYLDFILEQLSELEEITYKTMMGEYIFYYRGKIIGGIYDDRFLVKPVKSAIAYMPNAKYELPYDGAKEMLLVDDVDNKEYLTGLFNSMYKELPAIKTKKKKWTVNQSGIIFFCIGNKFKEERLWIIKK